MTDLHIPSHITVDEARGGAECSACHMGVDVSGVTGRGWIEPADMLAAFVVAHAIHDRKGNPSGLTPGGRARPAALAALNPKETR